MKTRTVIAHASAPPSLPTGVTQKMADLSNFVGGLNATKGQGPANGVELYRRLYAAADSRRSELRDGAQRRISRGLSLHTARQVQSVFGESRATKEALQELLGDLESNLSACDKLEAADHLFRGRQSLVEIQKLADQILKCNRPDTDAYALPPVHKRWPLQPQLNTTPEVLQITQAARAAFLSSPQAPRDLARVAAHLGLVVQLTILADRASKDPNDLDLSAVNDVFLTEYLPGQGKQDPIEMIGFLREWFQDLSPRG